MAEAKESKLKEYFTDTTHHFNTAPSDESGKRVFVGSARCPSALRKEAVIRLNDTYRSNWSLAHPDEEQGRSVSPFKKCNGNDDNQQSESGNNRTSATIVPVTNTIIDQ
jgi:hypothetical protein